MTFACHIRVDRNFDLFREIENKESLPKAGYPSMVLISRVLNMKRNRIVLGSLLLVFVGVSGCAMSEKTKGSEGTEGAMVQLADEMIVVRQARVFLDGVDKGLTPLTLKVDRRFGFSEIALRIGKERVRFFELEQTRSSNSSALAYSFNGNTDGYYTQFDVEELPQRNETWYYIPYRLDPLLITDREYGLDIIVQ